MFVLLQNWWATEVQKIGDISQGFREPVVTSLRSTPSIALLEPVSLRSAAPVAFLETPQLRSGPAFAWRETVSLRSSQEFAFRESNDGLRSGSAPAMREKEGLR